MFTACGTNPAYNSHLSTVTGTVEDQRSVDRGLQVPGGCQGQEFYYVIERKGWHAVRPCPALRYRGGELSRGAAGSLDESKPRKAALESAVLIYEVGLMGWDVITPFSKCAMITLIPWRFIGVLGARENRFG